MRMLIVTPIFPPEIGGPATYSSELSKELVERGHNITVVALADGELVNVPGISVVPVRLGKSTIGRQIRLLRTLYREVGLTELVYCQGGVDVGLGAYFMSRLLHRPFAVKFVGDLSWEPAFGTGRTEKLLEDFLAAPDAGVYYDIIRLIQGFVLRHADLVVIPSTFLRDLLIQYYDVPLHKLRVVLNAVDQDEYIRVVESSRPGNPRLTTIGRLVPWKNIQGILSAVAILAKRLPNIRLYVIGSGPERDNLEEYVRKLDLKEHVEFTGRLAHDETLSLVKASHAFILNSTYEGLPHVILEAQALGTPVVATNIKGTNECIENGETGLLVTPGDVDELSGAIESVIVEDEERSRLTTNAREYLTQHFSWKMNVSELETMLLELVGEDAQPSSREG